MTRDDNIANDKHMTLEQRRERLAAIASCREFTRQFHANDVLNAIDLLNKMDDVYKHPIIVREVRHSFTFILPDGTRFTPGILPQITETHPGGGMEDSET